MVLEVLSYDFRGVVYTTQCCVNYSVLCTLLSVVYTTVLEGSTVYCSLSPRSSVGGPSVR